MRPSNTERLSLDILRDLERGAARSSARLRSHLKDLLRFIATGTPPEPLLALTPEIRGLATHVEALRRHLARRSRLPEALAARYEFKQSVSKVRKTYRIGESEWRFVHRLADDLGTPLDSFVPSLDFRRCPWHDRLEEQSVRIELMLYEEALNDMLVCGLEGYLSPKARRRKGYEVYGLNLGMTRENTSFSPSRGVSATVYTAVFRSQPQLSAEGRYGGVEPSPRSLQAILEATAALFPQYSMVGDFHSHCYDSFSELSSRRGWRYSRADEESNIATFRELLRSGHRPWAGFILAVARSRSRPRPGRFRGLPNTLQTSVSGCRIILAAFRILGTGRYSDANVRLGVSGLLDITE